MSPRSSGQTSLPERDRDHEVLASSLLGVD